MKRFPKKYLAVLAFIILACIVSVFEVSVYDILKSYIFLFSVIFYICNLPIKLENE